MTLKGKIDTNRKPFEWEKCRDNEWSTKLLNSLPNYLNEWINYSNRWIKLPNRFLTVKGISNAPFHKLQHLFKRFRSLSILVIKDSLTKFLRIYVVINKTIFASIFLEVNVMQEQSRCMRKSNVPLVAASGYKVLLPLQLKKIWDFITHWKKRCFKCTCITYIIS